MAANTNAMVASLDAGPLLLAPFRNPQHWYMSAGAKDDGSSDHLGFYRYGIQALGTQTGGQYHYPLDAIIRSAELEAGQLGVWFYTAPSAFGAEGWNNPFGWSAEHGRDHTLGELSSGEIYTSGWVVNFQAGGNPWYSMMYHALVAWMRPSGYLHNANYDSGSDTWTLDTELDNAITMVDLERLANNISWCHHNAVSFNAFTNFLSGYHQTPDAAWPSDSHRPISEGGDGDEIAQRMPSYHPELSNTFSHFSQLQTLAMAYDAANTTINAHATIFASINSISVAAVSNNCPFYANTSVSLYTGGSDPTMNTFAMWLYTANGNEAETGSSPTWISRPTGFGTSHPATDMTVKEVYNSLLASVNNYTYFLRSFIDQTNTPAAGDYDPNPGVIPANTFIYESRAWLQEKADALSMIDIMSRVTLPGPVKSTVQNALANTVT